MKKYLVFSLFYILQSLTECYRVLQSIAEYCRVLQSVTGCYRVLQSVRACKRVLQSVTECYRVFLAHLLGPISGLVSIGSQLQYGEVVRVSERGKVTQPLTFVLALRLPLSLPRAQFENSQCTYHAFVNSLGLQKCKCALASDSIYW